MNRGSFLAIVLGLAAANGLIGALTRDNDEPPATLESATPAAVGKDDLSPGQSATTSEAASPAEATPADVPPMLGPAGTLENLDGWLQTDATSFEDFNGKVRIVQFWTYSCRNCKATIPFLQEIYADHDGEPFEIIGVHAPEFSFEEDLANVQQAAIEQGVTWPIAIDNSKTNFRSWQPGRRFWPRTFVIDQEGEIRFDRIGEGKYEELAATVDWLLENGP